MSAAPLPNTDPAPRPDPSKEPGPGMISLAELQSAYALLYAARTGAILTRYRNNAQIMESIFAMEQFAGFVLGRSDNAVAGLLDQIVEDRGRM